MSKSGRIVKRLLALAAIGGAIAWARSVFEQRRNPEPFPASQARILDNPVARAHANRVLDALDLAPGMKAVDVGAGVGRFSIPIAQKVGELGEVLAVDIQQEMLDIISKRAADAGVMNIKTLRAAAGDRVLPRGRFDRAIISSVLGEIPHERRVEALEEIYEGLTPGGILYVVETVGDPHYQTKRSTMDLGLSAGFTSANSRRIGIGHLTELIKPS